MSFHFGQSRGQYGTPNNNNNNNMSNFASCFNQSNNYGQNMMMNQMNYGGYSGNNMSMQSRMPQMGSMQMRQQQQHQQQQMQQMQMNGCGPRASVMSAGQPLDPNMKVIKLNWGDLLGGQGNQGTHGLKVAMVGANGDVSGGNPQGLKVTFNGQVPQGMPVHVMSINPYANILGQNNSGR